MSPFGGIEIHENPLLPVTTTRKAERIVPVFKLRGKGYSPAFRAEMDAWLEATFGLEKTEVVEIDVEEPLFLSIDPRAAGLMGPPRIVTHPINARMLRDAIKAQR